MLFRLIQGLKAFKLDWMSIWKFVVPHRDPSLLRRQWRIALGTQKSYKQDAAKKEKRRLYESNRRSRTADLANWHLNSDKEVRLSRVRNKVNSFFVIYSMILILSCGFHLVFLSLLTMNNSNS